MLFRYITVLLENLISGGLPVLIYFPKHGALIEAWNSTTLKCYVIEGQLEDKSETSSQYLGHENQPPNRGLRKRQATSSK